MKYVVNIAKTDEEDQIIERTKVGEFETEIDAIMKVSEEDRKLKKCGVKNTHVELLKIEDGNKIQPREVCPQDKPLDVNIENTYRMRLALETDIATDSVYHDIDVKAFKDESKQLKKLIKVCESQKLYEDWKQAFISKEFEKVKGQKFLTCTYIFAGIGQYEDTIPETELKSFMCWINGNGSAFFGGSREATESEIKQYIALHAADQVERDH